MYLYPFDLNLILNAEQRKVLAWAVLHDDVLDVEFLQKPRSALDHAPLPALDINLHQEHVLSNRVVEGDTVHSQVLIPT